MILTLDHVDVDATIKKINDLLREEKSLSPALKSTIEVLILIVTLLVNRLGLNSQNSSKPPSSDRYRLRKTKKSENKKVGGQRGHIGSTLKKVNDPDEIKVLKVDRRILPRDAQYREIGFEPRQVIDCTISMIVTEYQAQILEDENGKRYVAPFPLGVSRPVQTP